MTEEIKDASFTPVLVNGVDDPNILSATTVEPLPNKEEEAKTQEAVETASAEETVEKAEAVAVEDAATTKTKEKEEEAKETPPKNKEKDSVQRRIDEITKKRRIAERDLDFERKRRFELEEEVKKLKNTTSLASKPKQEDFAIEEEFIDALTDWKIEQKLSSDRQKTQKDAADQFAKDSIAAAVEVAQEKIDKGKDKYGDFEDIVLDGDLKITEIMVESIVSSDIAEDIFYYLGKNPDISADISEMPPPSAAREIGKIEAKLLAPPARKKTTSAPEPISPIKTNMAVEKDPERMSTLKEYRAWRGNK